MRDVAAAYAQFAPVMEALGYRGQRSAKGAAWFDGPGLVEIILYPSRDGHVEPHEHGRVGWQHLAYYVDSRDEVERLHEVALAAGWTAVREPKPYPRFAPDYFAVFVEEANGIRLEFAYCPDDDEGDADADDSPADGASAD